MDKSAFEDHIKQFPGVTAADNYGYTFFSYGSDQITPFATLIDADTEYDKVSDLNREGIFRINIGVSADSYKRLFPEAPGAVDYREVNVFMPHPEYSAQKFICILSPSGTQLERALGFVQEAYEIAKRRAEKRRPA